MAKKKPPPPTHFVVRRLNWAWTVEDDRKKPRLRRFPGEVRLQAFDEFDEAEADRMRRETAARQSVNPFRCGGTGFGWRTSLDEPRLHDWTLDTGLTPPKPKKKGEGPDWAGWWDKHVKKMTEYQHAKMWEAFDRLQFYEVVQQPRREIVYVVVRVGWRYTDEYYIADPEGGDAFEAYRDREEAESYCLDANDIGRDVWEEDLRRYGGDDELVLHQLNTEERCRQKVGPFEHPSWQWKSGRFEDLLTPEKVTFWEVVEVELEST